MFTENGLMVDIGELTQVVTQCDVFAAGFRLFPERLLVDTRSNKELPPFISVVEPVSSVQERFFWLGQKRPQFGMPQQFMFFVWPHSIEFFEESGLVERIRDRLRQGGWPRATAMCDEAMAELHRLESKANVNAIKGENYHTFWARPAPA
jgi:hypothetical protein